MNYGIFPLTCIKYEQTRVKTIMGTWAKDHLDVVTFLGDRHVETPQGQVLQINCMDPKDAYPPLTDNPYEDAPHKMFNAFRALADAENDWLFFCDDDTYVKISLLEEYIRKTEEAFGKEHVAVWGKNMLGNYERDRSLAYPSGGAGYLVNRATLQKVRPFLDAVERSTPDAWSDVMLGFALRSANIPIIDDGVFFDLSFEDEWKEWQWSQGEVNKTPAVSYHYMTPERMIALHQLLENKPAWI